MGSARPKSLKSLGRITWYFLVIVSILLACVISPCASAEQPQILVLNSYHKGYAWSDGVVNGIESSLYHQYPDAQISIEYLDTKRNNSADYMAKLATLFEEKYRPGQFDLVLAADDNSIHFALEKKLKLFGDIPLVFCGANHLDPEVLAHNDEITGVLEYSDIGGTIELALKLQPETDNIYVINDKTVTGRKVGEALAESPIALTKKVELHYLEDLPLEQLAEEIKTIGGKSIILLLAYLRDKEGTYYAPQFTATVLSGAASVPIFSVWDFFFNHGILGGVLTSGHLHGEAAGELAVKILQGADPKNLPVMPNGGNRLMVDYRQLRRFGMDETRVPAEAIVKNISYQEQKNVLVLLSYSLANTWNKSILFGIEETFTDYNKDVKLAVEFMDTKNYSDKAYLAKLSALYQLKYKQRRFDSIIVSDDNAFQFVMRNREQLAPNTPIIFCGVNYLENPEQYPKINVTGIMESYDILGTIRLGMELFPETKNLYVINDLSTSGKANGLKLREALPLFAGNLNVELCGNVSMQELLSRVAHLPPDTLIILMSFTMDRNNQRFSYQNSINLIYQNAHRPILGFWDFYLGEGIVGGVITSGEDQGRSAASMALDIMQGRKVADIPVRQSSPVQPTIDYKYLGQFEWNEKEFLPSYKVLNKDYTFFERNRKIVYIAVAILALLFLLILAQFFKIIGQKREQQDLSEKAVTDDLTGAKSRNYLLTHMTKQMEVSSKKKISLSICYFDIDNLKTVNDTYGHSVGDTYILHVISAIRKFVRSDDVLSRVGGDEFVVTLAGRSERKLAAFTHDINEELRECKIRHQLPYELGVSIGFSTYIPESDRSAQQLLERADKDMYRNKRIKKGMST